MRSSTAILSILVLAAVNTASALPMSTAIVYQGQLKMGGDPLHDTADFVFKLWDADSAGNQVGTTLQANDVLVEEGLFAVELDFAAAVFDGDARWLEIAVRSPHDPSDTAPFTTLSPRQSIAPVPYALQTRGMYVDGGHNVGIGTTSPDFRLHVSGGNIAADRGASVHSVVRTLTLGGASASQSDNQPYASIEFQNYDDDGAASDYVGASIASHNDEFGDVGDLRFSTKGGILTEQMRITPTGKVGIRVTDVSARLHLKHYDQGDALRITDNAGVDRVKLDESYHFLLKNGSGTDVVRIADDEGSYFNGGNVGVGTSTPSALLHLQNDDSGAAFKVTDNTGVHRAGLDGNYHLYLQDDSGTDVVRIADDADSFLNGGHVGIGTETPSEKLHVSGGNIAADRGASTVSTDRKLILGGARTTGNNPYASIEFQNYDDNGAASDYVGASIVSHNRGSEDAGDLRFFTKGTDFTERMRITESGDVGIGTSNPSAMLEVKSSVSDEALVRMTNNGTNEAKVLAISSGSTGSAEIVDVQNGAFVIDGNGNVGIGTTTTSALLHIQNDDSGAAFRLSDNEGVSRARLDGNYHLLLQDDSGSDVVRIADDASTYFNGGNVGVGTSTPTAKLHVVGYTKLSGNAGVGHFYNNVELNIRGDGSGSDTLRVENSAGDRRFSVNENGRVAIGDVAPQTPLHISANRGNSGSDGTSTDDHVVQIENTHFRGSGLLIRLHHTNIRRDNNFVSFWRETGSGPLVAGRIEGFKYPNDWAPPPIDQIDALICYAHNLGGVPTSIPDAALWLPQANLAAACHHMGVVYESGYGDYAEWLPRLNTEEKLVPGQIVGVYGGKITSRTDGAEQLMVISAAPIVLGNMPQPEKIDEYEMVGFMGQLHTWVMGSVNAGDFILASGNNDGYGIAKSADEIDIEDMDRIVGRAWEDGQELINLVKIVVGVKTNEWAEVFKKEASRRDALAAELRREQETINAARAELEIEMQAQRAENAELRERVAQFESMQEDNADMHRRLERLEKLMSESRLQAASSMSGSN